MTKSRGSLLLGVLASLALHLIILLPWLAGGHATPAAQPRAPRPALIAFVPPTVPPPEAGEPDPPAPEPAETPEPVERTPPPEPAPPEPAPPEPTPPEPAPAAKQPEAAPPQAAPPQPAAVQAPPPPEIRLSTVVTAPPSEEHGLAAPGGLAEKRSGDDGDGLPPMRIIWESPKHLAEVAGALGMRVVAVTDRNEVAGEVPLKNPFKLAPFNGELAVYSNRVRTLPLSFFGAGLIAATEKPIAAYWVLVPEPVDRQMVDLVKAALQRAGLPASQVDWVETKFTPDGRRQFKLEIIDIRQGRRT